MTGRLGKMAAAAAALLAPGAAAAQGVAPEAAVALLDHGVRSFFRGAPDADVRGDSMEERGTADVQFVFRGRPMPSVLGARPGVRVQLNTGGRTSFAAVGAEWRQEALRGRLYAQLGFGAAVHDGMRGAVRDGRTAFGSRVLFNPNASVGVRLGDRWAAEAAWEHFSHKGLLARRNPGIDTLGLRLVRLLGR